MTLEVASTSCRSPRLSAPRGSPTVGWTNATVGEITEKTDEDSRLTRRPIDFIDSPACQRSQISDR
jgi:hypothetical protein